MFLFSHSIKDVEKVLKDISQHHHGDLKAKMQFYLMSCLKVNQNANNIAQYTPKFR